MLSAAISCTCSFSWQLVHTVCCGKRPDVLPWLQRGRCKKHACYSGLCINDCCVTAEGHANTIAISSNLILSFLVFQALGSPS